MALGMHMVHACAMLLSKKGTQTMERRTSIAEATPACTMVVLILRVRMWAATTFIIPDAGRAIKLNDIYALSSYVLQYSAVLRNYLANEIIFLSFSKKVSSPSAAPNASSLVRSDHVKFVKISSRSSALIEVCSR
jgi:hypothetical protein